MFFYLSKIFAFILSPLIWTFILFIYSWRSKTESKKKRFFIFGLIVLYVFSNSFIADECMRAWEYTSEDMKKTEKFDYAIVLGGMMSYDEKLDKPQFSRGVDRLLQPLVLLQQKQVKKIILTGGSGSIEHPDHREAGILKKYLISIGIPDSAIIIENNSRNTRENALFTKNILDSLHVNSKILFVTSAFHMRRGIGCFNKVGITNIRPWCTDRFSGERKFAIDHCFIPNSTAMEAFTLLIHEISGYIIYKLSGYVS